MIETIISIAQEISGDNDIEWNEETSMWMDIGLCSLEYMTLITRVEAVFGIHLSGREISKIDTLGDLSELVERKVKK